MPPMKACSAAAPSPPPDAPCPARPTQAPLVRGTPLPSTGTCRHYPHSHRWLRFPCCGRLYACDLCHEEDAGDGHEAAWAKRMVSERGG